MENKKQSIQNLKSNFRWFQGLWLRLKLQGYELCDPAVYNGMYSCFSVIVKKYNNNEKTKKGFKENVV